MKLFRKVLDGQEVLEAALPVHVVDEVSLACHRIMGVVICAGQLSNTSPTSSHPLTASHLELAGVSVERIVVKVHPT